MNVKPLLQKLSPLISVVFFVAAIVIVHHEIQYYHLDQIKTSLYNMPPRIVVSMVVLTLIGYLMLSLYDFLALEYVHAKLPAHRILLTSFISFAISNNVGHALISGGSVRYRLYSAWNMPGASIAKVVIFCSFTYIIGTITLMVLSSAALIGSADIADNLSSFYLGIIIASSSLLFIGWWWLVLFYRKPFSYKGFTIAPPRRSLALKQTLVAFADLVVASLVLYLPLSFYTGMPFTVFLVLYVVAQLVGLVSQVPGGMGVFEGSFLFLTAGKYPSSDILAALIAYRVVYYFLPLLLAGLMLALYETKAHRLVHNPVVSSALGSLENFLPQIFSILFLLGGSILLFSGSTPAIEQRIDWLYYIVPLPLVEFSHLVSSVAGVILLFLSRAIWQRIDAAYFAAIGILGLGALASLAKGFDYEEAAILILLLIMFLPTRKLFYRHSALLTLDIPFNWIVLILSIVGFSIWLGFFSYKDVDYAHDLWWQFSFENDASRFLRSAFAILLLVSAFALYRFVTRTNAKLILPDDAMLDNASTLIERADETMPHLALVGDKYLFWSKTRQSFVMFAITAKFWIAMGDPVGNVQEFEQLAWDFREQADRYSASIAFYQVSTKHLPLYLNLGLVMTKLGEEALVDLQTFNLEGKKKQSLRHAYNKHQRENMHFEIVKAAEIAALMPQLENISQKWMKEKRVREKSFSLGFFNETYLKRCDVAIIRKDEQIIAFANLWQTQGHKELSVDLMRYLPQAPNGVMEFLTLSLLLWGKDQGYHVFNLGMAPLSGFERRPLAPMWHKIGNRIFRLGGDLYNFEGLYNYKKKFDPVWKPRYVASPSGFQVAAALFAVTGLVSGGLKGLVRK